MSWVRWNLNPANSEVSCEECRIHRLREDQGGCEACDRVAIPLPENILAIEAWTYASAIGRDGISGMLRLEAVIAAIHAMGGTREDIGKVITIECHQKKVKNG